MERCPYYRGVHKERFDCSCILDDLENWVKTLVVHSHTNVSIFHTDLSNLWIVFFFVSFSFLKLHEIAIMQRSHCNVNKIG